MTREEHEKRASLAKFIAAITRAEHAVHKLGKRSTGERLRHALRVALHMAQVGGVPAVHAAPGNEAAWTALQPRILAVAEKLDTVLPGLHGKAPLGSTDDLHLRDVKANIAWVPEFPCDTPAQALLVPWFQISADEAHLDSVENRRRSGALRGRLAKRKAATKRELNRYAIQCLVPDRAVRAIYADALEEQDDASLAKLEKRYGLLDGISANDKENAVQVVGIVGGSALLVWLGFRVLDWWGNRR